MKEIVLDGKSLTLEDIASVLAGEFKISVSKETKKRLAKVRQYVEDKLKSDTPLYGINTGFGMLASKKISYDELETLQENLIISHSAGLGDFFSDDEASVIMLLRGNVLAAGYSGIRESTLELLVQMLNKKIIPLIPKKGSVGASGDLSPLSHLALAMIGKGEVLHKGKITGAAAALKAEGLSPVKLAFKEGLALVNGTQAMTAIASKAILRVEGLIKLADIAGALSIEADKASARPFDERIHKIRPHAGQITTAGNIRRLLKESQIIKSHTQCKRVQDPYSFRCIPQVHGAVKDAYRYCRSVVECEINSCTDNPLIFHDDDEIISGGNFHGEPIAIAMDTLSIAVSELGSISERRVAILLSPLEGEIPVKYLVSNPGLNSGLAPMHVSMAALVSENKTLAHPASVDTIPTFAGQEDHVSMGMWGAVKAMKIIENVEGILGMELIAAAQGIDVGNYLNNKKNLPGVGTRKGYEIIRRDIPYLDKDRELYIDIKKSLKLVVSGVVVREVEKLIGELEV